MANVSHAALTGSQLHEPKGASTAALGQVYVANGSGSGSWADVGTAAFTGMVADFISPLPPSGWLELDGSVISSSTYSGLYATMTIATSGTRTNGSAIITSVPTTAGMKIGYYVFGTGINSGTTIASVDSSTQITLSAVATSSGTSSFAVSPWLINSGTIKLPDLTTAGRYRRSRTSSTKVGDVLADQNKAHTHDVSGTTGLMSADHTHSYSGNTSVESASHTHTVAGVPAIAGLNNNNGGGGGIFAAIGSNTTYTTSGESATHVHSYSGLTGGVNTNHAHSFNATSTSNGGTEARPLSIVVLTCVKT